MRLFLLLRQRQHRLIAVEHLAKAYDEWRRCRRYDEKRSFCNRYFLSNQTLEYIHQLRRDLETGVRATLARDDDLVSSSRVTPSASLSRTLSSVLVAALWPKVPGQDTRGRLPPLESFGPHHHESRTNDPP